MRVNPYKEKDLENYVATNPGMLWEAAFSDVDVLNDYSLLGTQIECSVGIIDMLFCSPRGLYIVEFKAERATEATIGQLARYRDVINFLTHCMCTQPLIENSEQLALHVLRAYVPLHSFVVAPSFTPKCLKALRYSGVAILAEQKPDGTFALTRPNKEYGDNSRLEGILKEFMVSFVRNGQKSIRGYGE